MKRLFLFALPLMMGVSASAQQKVYVCDGFNAEAITIGSADDIVVSEASNSLQIGSKTFKLSEVDSVTFNAPMFNEVKVAYNGSTATVTIPSYVKGVTSSVTGSTVVLTSKNTTDEILYTVSGTSSNGSLTIIGEYKLSVALAGLNLTSTTTKAPIDVECGKRINLILNEGTTNTITDGASNAAKGAFYTSGHLEIEGGGTLNVKGNAKHALCAKEYLQIKKTTGKINILGAVSDGIHCGKGKENDDNSFFQINGGEVTVSNAGSDCIDCDDYGCAIIKGGNIVLNVTQKDGTGIKADSCIYMTGGNINVDVAGNISDGIRASYAAYFDGGSITAKVSGMGARGIRAKKTTKTTDTVLNGGYLYFNGTNADITVTGTKNVADNTVCYGIKADTEFKQTAGTVTITVSSTDDSTKAYNFKSNTSTGGTLNVK